MLVGRHKAVTGEDSLGNLGIINLGCMSLYLLCFSHMVMILSALVKKNESTFLPRNKYTPLRVHGQYSVLFIGNVSVPQIVETVGHFQHLSVLSLCNLADLSSQTS